MRDIQNFGKGNGMQELEDAIGHLGFVDSSYGDVTLRHVEKSLYTDFPGGSRVRASLSYDLTLSVERFRMEYE